MFTTIRPLLKYILIVCLLASVFAYAMFQGGFVSWFLFYSVTSVVFFTIFVAFFPFRVKKVERVLSQGTIPSGGSLDVTIVLEKHRLQPFFFLRIEDKIPGQLKSTESDALFFFTFQQQLSFSYTIASVPRGVHSFRSLTLVFSDLFGLIERRTSIKCEDILYVLPKVHTLKALPFTEETKELEGKRVNQFDHAGRSISGVRKYIPGDRITSIDWKQSARGANLMTKEFESFQGEEVIVAFDPYMYDEGENHFERVVELVATLMIEFAKKKPQVQLAIRSKQWMMMPLSQQSLTEGLKLLAQVTSLSQPIEPMYAIYQKWKSAHVAFVCTEVSEPILKTCETMIGQGAYVTIYMLATSARDEDLSIIRELEKMGVNLYKVELE